MRLEALGPRSGKLVDIAADPLGWVVCYQDEADGHLRLVQLTPEGQRRVPDVVLWANGGNAFPVLNGGKQTWLAYRDDHDGHGALRNVTAGTLHDLGVVYGNSPIAFGDGLCAYQATPAYVIEAMRLSDLSTYLAPTAGRPTGLAYVSGAGVVLVDDVRLSVPGMVNPREAGGCAVGENASGVTRNIARLTDGRICELWQGVDSFTPRIAFNGRRWAVVTWGGPGVRLALLEDADFAAPQPPPPEPAPDWTRVPDGTLVTDAFRLMFGANPPTSPDGRRICLHKNVNEQEWREVRGGMAYHLFDRSRYPGDEGWYLVDAKGDLPIWAWNTFDSGDSDGFDGEIVEMKDGRRNRWTHTNTFYGLTAGGVCVQFDPRFYGQDYGPEKCYERQFTRADGRIRWELWYSPEASRALPWGDRSRDVLKQAVEAPADPNATPLPYIECPRLSVDDDPWKPEEPPMPDLKSREQFFAEFRALNAFYAAQEGLQRPGGMLFPVDAGNPIAHVDVEAMAAWGYDLMTGASVESCKARIRSSDEWKQKHAGDPVQPVTFSGPIGVEGDEFVTP